MKFSYRIAFAGAAALLCSTTASFAAPASVPQGPIVSAIAQSDLRSILRDIRKGVPVAEVLSRYNLTAADLQRLEQLADQLGIDDLRDFRREVRAIIREIRTGTPLQEVLAKRGLSPEDFRRALEIAQRLGVDIGRLTDRLEKHAPRTAKRPRTDDETTGSLRGASRFAPGHMKQSGESARLYAPGQRAVPGTDGASRFAPGQQMRSEELRTGAPNGVAGEGEGSRAGSGARGLDRADEVAGNNGAHGRDTARDAGGGGGHGQGGGKGHDGDKSK